MEATYVNVSELRVGKIIAEDIFANTQYPIMFKNTKVTHEHLHVFNVFQINSVLIFSEESSNANLEEKGSINNDTKIVNNTIPEINTFQKIYDDAVIHFKKEFKGWEAGTKPDISKARLIILPLVERILENRSIIFDLNDFSSPKEYLHHHCIATGLIAAVLSQKLGYDRGFCIQMAIGGLLADCGMAKINSRIREKKTSLTKEEFQEIKKHPVYSYQMVKELPVLKTVVKEAIFQHHERLDGSGYPKGDKIDAISILSQVIAVADVFHAMTSERIYRSKESAFKVIEMIKESEFGKFDIKVVQALINLVADLPIGTVVELSNLERGEVMFVNKFSPTRPLIKLEGNGEIIDLAKHRIFYIARIIN